MTLRFQYIAVVMAVVAACGDETTGPGDLTPVASVAITPIDDTLLTRESFRLEVRALDREGNTLSDRPVHWESAQPAVVSVTAGGVLTALAAGTTTISATIEGIENSVTVTVRTLQLVQVYPGAYVGCGLEASGDAWCWGQVGAGGYGNGALDTTLRHVPSRAAVGHRFTSLALGAGSICGLQSSGTVLCWGDNSAGQLGDGSTTTRAAPVAVAGLTGIVQLAGGWLHYCARSEAGAVSCWGSNEAMQTAQPVRGIEPRPLPVALPGPASEIGAGNDHTCALVGAGALCWGSDQSWQLGHDTVYDRLVPTLAANGDGVSRAWAEVEASNEHTCGRDVAGAMFCWGVLPGTVDFDVIIWSPARRFEGLTATDIAGGWSIQCAVSTQQKAHCDSHDLSRVELPALGVSSVVVAGGTACVLLTSGVVRCELRSLERGRLNDVTLPAPATRIAANDGHVCALDNLGAVYCWSIEDAIEPEQYFDGFTNTGVHGASGRRFCVTTQSGAVVCRGFGGDEGEETVQPTGGVTLVKLAVGDYHTCGITAAGAAWCWGENDHGQLGDGTMVARTQAALVQGGLTFTEITAGIGHTCALTAAGAIYCWGRGSLGAMGDDNRDESAEAVTVDGAPALTRLGAMSEGACGLDASGAAWCWPEQARFGEPGAHQIPGTTGLTTIDGPCGRGPSGDVLCWGYNWSGWFGNGTWDVLAEGAVPGGNGIRFSHLSFTPAGRACGVAVDGPAYCWGESFRSSLGSPDGEDGLVVLPVRLYGSP